MKYIIPVTSAPGQTSATRVPVDGRTLELRLTLRYNEAGGYWWMTLTDPPSGRVLLDAVPLLTGVNILEQHDHLGLGSAYVVPASDDARGRDPGPDDLGTEFTLLWGDSEPTL